MKGWIDKAIQDISGFRQSITRSSIVLFGIVLCSYIVSSLSLISIDVTKQLLKASVSQADGKQELQPVML